MYHFLLINYTIDRTYNARVLLNNFALLLKLAKGTILRERNKVYVVAIVMSFVPARASLGSLAGRYENHISYSVPSPHRLLKKISRAHRLFLYIFKELWNRFLHPIYLVAL